MEPSTDWKIFQGSRQPHGGMAQIPEPPNWRDFGARTATKNGAGTVQTAAAAKKQRRGANFYARPEEIDMVNAALYLRRPLLVTGKPGTGKTSLAYAVAYELQLGEVLYWPITTRTTLKEGLYSYDAVGRLQDFQLNKTDALNRIGKYLTLGPLGTALLPAHKSRPRVLLVDEIDKSDIDLPNDLLHVFEDGEFKIPELERIADEVNRPIQIPTAYGDAQEPTFNDEANQIENGKLTLDLQHHRGRFACTAFPFVILTSNGERDFPPAFLRRCLRLDMGEPDQTRLKQIVAAHLQDSSSIADKLIETFLKIRNQDAVDLSTDQLLNAVYLVAQEKFPAGKTKDDLVKALMKDLNKTEG